MSVETNDNIILKKQHHTTNKTSTNTKTILQMQTLYRSNNNTITFINQQVYEKELMGK